MVDISFINMLRKQADLTDDAKDRFLMLRAADELEVGQDNWASLFCRILNDKENFKHAEMYRHLRNAACNAPHDAMSPAVVLCNGDMSKFEWLDGDIMDKAVLEDMQKDYYFGV